MNGLSQRACANIARLFDVTVVALCLLLSGLEAYAYDARNLNLAVSDVFPFTRSDLNFTEDPDLLRLAQASTESDAEKAWETALPPPGKFDWVQTTSGEWLKGKLKVLYNESLEFDSGQFGLQTIGWGNVAQFRGHGIKRLSFDTPDGPIAVDGHVFVTRETVTVVTDKETREFPRSKLISITPGAKKETDNWSAKIGLGVTFSRGNSDQTDMSAKANIKRRTSENRFVVDYLGNFSSSGGTQTTNNHRLNSYFDIFAGKHFFWRPAFLEYYRDPFQNLDYRATIGAAAGYRIIDTPKTTWDVSGGPGYRATRYVSVQPGDSQKVTTPALIGSTAYETTLTKTLDFNALYNFSVVNKESGTYTHHATATFEIKLTDLLDFDITFVWDRTQNPQARSDGTVPKQDDFQLLLTFGVDI